METLRDSNPGLRTRTYALIMAAFEVSPRSPGRDYSDWHRWDTLLLQNMKTGSPVGVEYTTDSVRHRSTLLLLVLTADNELNDTTSSSIYR